jgi:hypothetical protein
MKTYQKYFLVYSFLGVVLISAGTLACGIGSLPTGAYNVEEDPIGAYDLQEVGMDYSRYIYFFDRH